MSFAQPFHEYEILDRVGAGAMGTVFKARQKKLGRIVALKVLRPSLARDERYVDRLRREARIVAALNHPNIVTGYDLGEENGYHYFVMEFVEGKSLRALLGEWGIFAEEQVLRVAMQVASALDHAVQRGVIHRDIKPGNILIDEAGLVKLTDMGLAKGPADLALTRDGATVGTPQYISPEQAKNPQDVDVRSDLYSLGATLYHMATGQPPFKGDSMAEVITKVLHEAPVAPRLLNPQLSEGLALVIRKLLAKNLRLRYQTPRELLDDLERVRDDLPPAVDESRLSAGEVGPQASVWLWTVATAAGAAVLLLAVWIGMQLRSERTPAVAPDEFLAALERELPGLETAGQRLMRLRAAKEEQHAGTRGGIQRLLDRVQTEIQEGVDRVAQELQGPGWPQVRAWLDDPDRWPSVRDFERERLQRALLLRTGLLREQLPTGVRSRGFEAVIDRVEETLRQRDQRLVSRFQHHLHVKLPALSDAALRRGDFVAAERVWTQGFASFFDGVRQPLPEAVDEAIRRAADQDFARARADGLAAVDANEKSVAAALREHCEGAVAAIRAGMQSGADAAALLAAAARLRQHLQRSFPSRHHFRPQHDEWPAVEAALARLDLELSLHAEAEAGRRVEGVVELAWRAFCGGDAQAALAVLGSVRGETPELQPPLLAAHRRALRAGGEVARAIVRALRHAAGPIPGHPRDGGPPVRLLVVGGDRPQLRAEPAGGGSPRNARVTEFLFADLWEQASAADPHLLRDLPAEDAEIGRVVLAMVGDELAPVAEPVQGSQGAFLVEEVWPVIVRVRGEAGRDGIDRAMEYRRLQDALAAAREGGDLDQVAVFLSSWRSRFQAEASAEERRAVGEADRWLEAERRRRQRLQAWSTQLPGAQVRLIEQDDRRLCAEVDMPAAVLERGAHEGWERHGDRLQFGSGAQSFTGLPRHRLDIDAGVETGANSTSLQLDLILPAAEQPQRIYLLGFRGIGLVLAATADDRAVAALVEGDPRRQETVLAACHRALRNLLGEDGEVRAAPLFPGAVHRLRVAVEASPPRTLAMVTVHLDATELARGQVPFEPDHPPSAVLLPLQDVGVAGAAIRAAGLKP